MHRPRGGRSVSGIPPGCTLFSTDYRRSALTLRPPYSYYLATLRVNGAYIVPKAFLASRLRRCGCGTVSNSTCRLRHCISFKVACTLRHCAMASASHSNCSLDKATLTVLPLTLRVH